MKIKLSAAGPPKQRNENFEAYQLYLKGLFHWNKRTGVAMERAIDFFQQAIDADPTYPQPYCGLADSLMLSALFAWAAPQLTMLRAKHAASSALKLDPALAEAHVSLAMVNYLYDWDAAAAAEHFHTGLELNPGYAIGRAFHAHFLLWTGSYGEAMREIREALDLDPLSLNMITNLGWFLIYQRRPEEAEESLRKALDLDPGYVRANLYLGAALAMMGRGEEAIAASRRAVESSPNDPILLLWLARVYALSGRETEARECLFKWRNCRRNATFRRSRQLSSTAHLARSVLRSSAWKKRPKSAAPFRCICAIPGSIPFAAILVFGSCFNARSLPRSSARRGCSARIPPPTFLSRGLIPVRA